MEGLIADDNNSDPNQDAANQVKQRGADATVDLGEEPSGDQANGVKQNKLKPENYSGDVKDTVDGDATDSGVDPET